MELGTRTSGGDALDVALGRFDVELADRNRTHLQPYRRPPALLDGQPVDVHRAQHPRVHARHDPSDFVAAQRHVDDHLIGHVERLRGERRPVGGPEGHVVGRPRRRDGDLDHAGARVRRGVEDQHALFSFAQRRRVDARAEDVERVAGDELADALGIPVACGDRLGHGVDAAAADRVVGGVLHHRAPGLGEYPLGVGPRDGGERLRVAFEHRRRGELELLERGARACHSHEQVRARARPHLAAP